MSFILDALKKSETDRQTKGSSEFSTVPAGSATPRAPRWIWALLVLLAINIIGVLWLLLRPAPADLPVSAVVTTPAPRPAVAAPEPDQPTSFEQRVEQARATQPSVAVVEVEPEPEAVAPQREPGLDLAPAPAALPAPASAGVADDLPTILDVRLRGDLALPELHLDIHVFSDVPADRFVFINMNKHREGSTLEEGPRVAEITVDGVVLDYQGQRFKLPRE